MMTPTKALIVELKSSGLIDTGVLAFGLQNNWASLTDVEDLALEIMPVLITKTSTISIASRSRLEVGATA